MQCIYTQCKAKTNFHFFFGWDTFTWENSYQEKWKLVLALHWVASPWEITSVTAIRENEILAGILDENVFIVSCLDTECHWTMGFRALYRQLSNGLFRGSWGFIVERVDLEFGFHTKKNVKHHGKKFPWCLSQFPNPTSTTRSKSVFCICLWTQLIKKTKSVVQSTKKWEL